MRLATDLIEQNNLKREDLNEENLAVYEDFLLYLRTDLRVDEQASEEVLMDVLDHLLEAQEHGKSAADIFGNRPQDWADELLENLPREKKRNVAAFVFSQVFGLAGWFALSYGVIDFVLSLFTPVDSTTSVSGLLITFGTVVLVGFAVVVLLFKIIRSTVFQPKKKLRAGYVKAGFIGAAAFAVIVSSGWLIPDFGPAVQIDWWVYAACGLACFAAAKIFSISAKN